MNRKISDKLMSATLRRAVKLLRKYKVEEPYYVEVENPIESGDPLNYSLKESPF